MAALSFYFQNSLLRLPIWVPALCWICRRRSVQKVSSVLLFCLCVIPVTLLAIANFVGTPFDVTGKTVMATILFMLYGLFLGGTMNCSYGAMVPAITKNPNERASLAAWRQGGATLGLLLCTVGFVPVMNLIEGNQQLGYIFAATLFSLFGLLFMSICYSGVKERYVETQPANPAQKPGLLQSFRAIAGNRPLFILCIANLCTLGAFNVKLAIQVYYTQYVLNDPSCCRIWDFSAWAVFSSAYS